MILDNIEGLELYIEQSDKTRVRLNRELNIGESAFVGNSINKIKRISDNEYMFLRFDTIATHIYDYQVNHDLKELNEAKNEYIDYDVKYGLDRVEIIEHLLKQNNWIYDLISTNRMIKKEIKNKSDFLAENQTFNEILDSMATYIYMAKFDSAEHENKHSQYIEELDLIKKKDKRKKTKDDFDRLNHLIDCIQGLNYKSVNSNRKIESVGFLPKRELYGDFVYQEELREREKKVKRKFYKEDIASDYWDKMYSSKRKTIIPFYDGDLLDESKNKSIPHKEFRPQALDQMKKSLLDLKIYLGIDIKDVDKKKKYVDELKKRIGNRDYRIIRKMYNDLKHDYELAKKILTDEIYFPPSKHSTVYDINSDTWYINEQGELVEISKNTVSLGNVNTYKGLILNYKDLRDKYKDKQQSDWWALLKDFEYILKNTEFTEEEKFVLDVLFDGYSQKQIKDKYETINLEKINKNKINRLINEVIPNKLLNTYLDFVQDWLVIHWNIGKYKVCSMCNEAKLANERYFGKDVRNRDGLQSLCKKCDSYRK